MKLKCFVLLIFLDVCGPSLAVSSINESEVESYSVTRRRNTPELFTVKMKDGHDCARDGEVWSWCNSLSAHRHSAWENRSSCSCSCDNTIPLSFLPALQTCINASVADNFGGEHVQNQVLLSLVFTSDASISASTSASKMLRFHTTQANASISASARKRKNFDPYACAYAYAYAGVASENQALSPGQTAHDSR